MNNASKLNPVLFIGGSGVVGRRAVKALRDLQPHLPLRIGARDVTKASALAREVGHADAVRIDLERDDLGLPPGSTFSAIVVLLKDDSLRTLRYAQDQGVPYVSFSDFVFDIGPEVALHVQRPTAAPTLLLGHFLGGTVALATLHFARELAKVHAIRICAVFDEEDVGGPAALGDMDRVAKGVPSPLIRKEGRFLWATSEADLTRTFQGVDGTQWQGRAYPLLDVASLAAVTDASDIRLDFALRPASRRAPGQGPGHEVIIELEGVKADGTPSLVRHALVDADVHSGLSGKGAALAVERLLGLTGGTPVEPGLYSPEGVLDAAYVVSRLQEWGTRIHRV
ncbi:NAD(P)-dependent oxidoreductase [Myxococcus sp. MISCRS1]|uniref:NAD(P)-dependent oxidoreductase n=1 Tax=unclassified Myxococcus TaxID=2648731 RepID=UPI001CC01B25|nr:MULTISPECIES: NAD(P)-dependent oxidoreductase [unclassified Myxococcus]MBZ4412718.1 NAD(P)-dependent oxidoreductase [Myxococcus sp. XM-1-1-1]MCY1000046.1 NAD(P)-dependent oxidoreductase [Myxococcus sp. MISCRS1]